MGRLYFLASAPSFYTKGPSLGQGKGWQWSISIQALARIPFLTLFPLHGDLEAPKDVDGLTGWRRTCGAYTSPTTHPSSLLHWTKIWTHNPNIFITELNWGLLVLQLPILANKYLPGPSRLECARIFLITVSLFYSPLCTFIMYRQFSRNCVTILFLISVKRLSPKSNSNTFGGNSVCKA